jgi:biopolymer transport protein ExbD
MGHRRHKHEEEHVDEDVDLNPLIDVITMLIIFFILGGRMSSDIRSEQITVPPTKTATDLTAQNKDWQRVVVNLFGDTQRTKGSTHMGIRVGNKEFHSSGVDDYSSYIGLRALLDSTYDHAERFADPKGTGLQLPKVMLEIRADADTQYRVVQEVQQVVSDSINPSNKMLPSTKSVKDAKPFVNINFTTRLPGSGN